MMPIRSYRDLEVWRRGMDIAEFLRVARGSLRELETHLMLAERVGIAPAGSMTELLAVTDELGRRLHSLLVGVEAGRPQRGTVDRSPATDHP